MSMTSESTYWHTQYEQVENEKEGKDINRCFKLMREYLTANGYACANDDRAEELVSAITKYIMQSAA